MNKRKLLGVSPALHKDINDLAKREKLPMTIVLDALVTYYGPTHDWEAERKAYKQNRPTWPNMRKRVREILASNPGATDKDIMDLTGYSLTQVEILTYTAHKRAIACLKQHPHLSSAELAQLANVTTVFAKRIWDQKHGEKDITTHEAPLWDL